MTREPLPIFSRSVEESGQPTQLPSLPQLLREREAERTGHVCHERTELPNCLGRSTVSCSLRIVAVGLNAT